MSQVLLQISNASGQRAVNLKKGIKLEVVTVCWNLVEGGLAVTAGISAGSIALIGFGVDSFIETGQRCRRWLAAVDGIVRHSQ